jgi:RP/EB family microtubule-associated protein
MSGDTIGMMEGAFFVGRGELLSWANETFGLSLTKVEQCATGALYCQIIDAVFPGTISMAKVRWGAKHDYEFVENYKILQ